MTLTSLGDGRSNIIKPLI